MLLRLTAALAALHWRHSAGFFAELGESVYVFMFCAGLSVAKVDHVSGDTVIFRGADVVDGTPVLDIKPYIPYVDGGVGAQAPAWVSV